jgi:hypothetical protein
MHNTKIVARCCTGLPRQEVERVPEQGGQDSIWTFDGDVR